jgi:hypothetical protein
MMAFSQAHILKRQYSFIENTFFENTFFKEHILPCWQAYILESQYPAAF